MRTALLLAVIAIALLWGEPKQKMKPAYLPWEGWPGQWRDK